MYVFVCRQVDAALDDVVKMDTGGGGGGGGGGRGRGRGGPMRGRGGPMRGRGGFRGGMMGMRAVPYGGRGGQVCDNCFQPGISSLHFCSYGFCAHGGFGFVLLISMDHTMFTHILKLWDNLLMTLAFCVQVTWLGGVPWSALATRVGHPRTRSATVPTRARCAICAAA